MSTKLIYRCPRCNALFEASDYGEHGAVCRWCGNEVGTEETIEINDDKQLLTDILNNREELDAGAGVPSGKLNFILVALCCTPFLYTLYDIISGEPVRWYMYLLMGISAFLFIGMYVGWKESRDYYKMLKNLIVTHNYSLVSLSSEIAVLRGWEKNVETAREASKAEKDAHEKTYRCSNCKALFEIHENSENAPHCPHCGQEADDSKLVQIGNDRKIVLDILNDREELNERIGINYPSKMNIGLMLISLLPLLWVFHHIIFGDPIRWYLILFTILGAVLSFWIYSTTVLKGKAEYKAFRKLAEKHNYSIVSMSTEIAALEAKASSDDDDDDEYTQAAIAYMQAGYPKFLIRLLILWKVLNNADASDMAIYLNKLIDYVLIRKQVSGIYRGSSQQDMLRIVENLVNYLLSKATVQETYSTSERKGIAAETQDEPFVYIVPPSRCPGCNHIYTSQELNANSVVCPHCSTEIQWVDKAVRSQVQQQVKDFLLFSMRSFGRKLSKKMLYVWGGIAGFCLILMAVLGIPDFYCSVWAIIWFMACVSLVSSIQSNMAFIQLYGMYRKGVYDLTELELMIRNRAPIMLPEFYKFKAELVKGLRK